MAESTEVADSARRNFALLGNGTGIGELNENNDSDQLLVRNNITGRIDWTSKAAIESGGGSIPDLDAVLTQGNTSDLSIELTNGTQTTEYFPTSTIHTGASGTTTVIFTDPTDANEIAYPNKSGVLAVLSDIPEAGNLQSVTNGEGNNTTTNTIILNTGAGNGIINNTTNGKVETGEYDELPGVNVASLAGKVSLITPNAVTLDDGEGNIGTLSVGADNKPEWNGQDLALGGDYLPRTGTAEDLPMSGVYNIDPTASFYLQRLDGDDETFIYIPDDGSSLQLSRSLDGFQSSLNISPQQVRFATSDPDSRGLTANQDHSANIQDLDYTQKKYVDDAIDGAIASIPSAQPTNLTNTPSPTTVAVNSSTGTGTNLPLATTTNAGLLAPADKTKLNALSGTNTGDNVQATETVAGIAEIATQAETNTGTNDTNIVTPLKLDNKLGLTKFFDKNTNISTNTTVLTSHLGQNGMATYFANASSAPVTLTLIGAANLLGYTIHIVKTDSSANAVTIQAPAGVNINASNTYVLTSQYERANIKSNGTQFFLF